MYGKKALKVYQQGPQHGKFNSLYGTGDHPSEGGSIVKGVSGPIHVMAGVEKDIMKEHGPEGEYILMQKNGYNSFAEVPESEDGNKRYGRIKDWLREKHQNIYEKMSRGGTPEGLWDTTQLFMGWGEYSEEEMDKADIEKRLGGFLGAGFESLKAGSEKMLGTEGETGFIDQQLQEQLQQFGTQKEMLDTAGGRLDIQTTGVQQGMRKQYGGVRDIGKKTGLVSGGPDFALEDVETQGEMQMANIGAGRQDLASQSALIGSQERSAVTQAEVDKYKYRTETSTAMATMLSDYMSATGEDVPEEFYDIFTEYSEQNI